MKSDRTKGYRFLFYFWLVIIFILTSYPTLPPLHDKLVSIDKVGHFAVYLILAFFYMKKEQKKDISKTFKKILLLAIFLPIIDELHQIPIPGRDFSFLDILADYCGFLFIIVIFKIKSRKSSHSLTHKT